MDHYRTKVAEWLVSDGRTLLAEEQYLRTSNVKELKYRKQKYMWPDIVAVRLRDREAFLCEVTWSRNWSALKGRLNKYAERMPNIREALDHWLGISADFSVTVRYFVPKDHIGKIEARKPPDLQLEFTALEDTVPWSYVYGQRGT